MAKKTTSLIVHCKNCGTINWSFYTSSSSGKKSKYCKTCRQKRARTYSKRKELAEGSHTRKEWEDKVKLFDKCPGCNLKWDEIPKRPDRRYKSVITKDHIVPLSQGGSDMISNIQPLCYRCNFAKR